MEPLELRPVIYQTVAVAALLAMAPWFTGGRDWAALTITAFAMLLAGLLVWRQGGVPAAGDRRLGVVYGLFLAWSLASLGWSVNRYQTITWCLYLVLAGLVFVSVSRLRQVPQFRSWLVKGYLLSALAAAGYGLWLYLSETYPRLTSSFYWPNPMAAYLIPAVIYCLDRAAGSWGYRLLGMVLTASFLLTDSRGATLALVAGLALYVAWQRPKKAYWINLLFIGLVAFGLSIGIGQLRANVFHAGQGITPGSRFAEAAAGDSNSVSDRLNYLKSSVTMWRLHPLTGSGAGTFGAVHPPYQIRVVSAATNPHNIIAQVLAELGLPGAVLLVVLASVLLLGCLRSAAAQAELAALACGVVGLSAHFVVDMDSRYPALIMLAAALAGLTYRPSEYLAKRLWWPAAAATAAVVVAVSGFESQVWTQRAQAAQLGGDYQQAADDYGQAHSYLVYDPDTLTGEGINLYTLAVQKTDAAANLRLALDKARQASRKDPNDAQHYFLAARVERFSHNWAAATRDYQQAIKLDPFNHPEYYDDLARLQLLEHLPAQAVQTATACLKQYPQSVIDNRSADQTIKPALASLYLARAEAYHDLGHDDLAHRDAVTAAPLLVPPKDGR